MTKGQQRLIFFYFSRIFYLTNTNASRKPLFDIVIGADKDNAYFILAQGLVYPFRDKIISFSY